MNRLAPLPVSCSRSDSGTVGSIRISIVRELSTILPCGDPARLWKDVAALRMRNGDCIEIRFSRAKPGAGFVSTGVVGGYERAFVNVNFEKGMIDFGHSDWTRPRPAPMAIPASVRRARNHVLVFRKTSGCGTLVKMANLEVILDGNVILDETDLDILPELGAYFKHEDVVVERIVHRGEPRKDVRCFRLGGWQVVNTDSIAANLASILRGIGQAAERGIHLLVTPETSLTGLFPTSDVTRRKRPIAEAEASIRQTLRRTRGAPYLVVGLPVWKRVAAHRNVSTRFNASRVYAPDGGIVGTFAKVHSCEPDFWHGRRLQEFDVEGVPVCMHICHDGRYPELLTLPVMFGAKVILHPANGGTVSGSVDAFECVAKQQARTAHAFYIHVNGGGGSFISGPDKGDNLLAVSAECARESSSFPLIGDVRECLIEATIDPERAYGYWPVRSFRASEQVAEAYCRLYQSMGGKRLKK